MTVGDAIAAVVIGGASLAGDTRAPADRVRRAARAALGTFPLMVSSSSSSAG
ncbi:hypothetical protein ABZ079_00850 [Streptomyces sp. NPDC006314]|uniref:hypothetical protein n=1 Tax=Streptomyces sp. NPDC006314 TaxID=3154475 RepID=UPI0033ABEF79